MENALKTAENDMLEWWFIFSQTGEINDCMAFLESMKLYEQLLSDESEMEM